jgi:hypothetical protein
MNVQMVEIWVSFLLALELMQEPSYPSVKLNATYSFAVQKRKPTYCL